MESPSEAEQARQAMTDRLVSNGTITSAAVEAAFRAVPRHEFVPVDTPLDTAYDEARSVMMKRDADGRPLSSVSAAGLQARMIDQAGLGPGMSVLEIGSGGYNAALLAEVTGPDGRVVSADIDPEVTQRAAALLRAAGYGDRVTVVTADAEHEVPGHAPYDAIIVTAAAWDIPPAWTAQLADGGTLVVPLRMNHVTQSIGFHRDGDHLASSSAVPCRFVPVQGAGAHPPRVFSFADHAGGHAEVAFEDGAPDDPSLPDGILTAAPHDVWPGVVTGYEPALADLFLWLAGFSPGFCRVLAADSATLAGLQAGRDWFQSGLVLGDSLAYLTARPGPEGAEQRVELGARGHGRQAAQVAAALAEQVSAWHHGGRALQGTAYAYWPAGVTVAALPAPTAFFRKAHGTITVTWPTS